MEAEVGHGDRRVAPPRDRAPSPRPRGARGRAARRGRSGPCRALVFGGRLRARSGAPRSARASASDASPAQSASARRLVMRRPRRSRAAKRSTITCRRGLQRRREAARSSGVHRLGEQRDPRHDLERHRARAAPVRRATSSGRARGSRRPPARGPTPRRRRPASESPARTSSARGTHEGGERLPVLARRRSPARRAARRGCASSTRVGSTFSPPSSTIVSFARPRKTEVAVLGQRAEVAGVEPAVGGEDAAVSSGSLW